MQYLARTLRGDISWKMSPYLFAYRKNFKKFQSPILILFSDLSNKAYQYK